MRVDIKVPFKCEPLKAIQDVAITIAVNLNKTNDPVKITNRMLSEKYPFIQWDIVDFDNLEQDSYSQTHKNILGLVRKNKYTKMYVYQCEKCLSSKKCGMAIFIFDKRNGGAISCNCSDRPNYCNYEWIVKIYNKTISKNVLFLSANDEKIQSNKKVKLFCYAHKKIFPVIITNLFKPDRDDSGCGECKTQKLRHSDSSHSDVFLATGHFVEGTRFWRSDKTRNGRHIFWNYYCPVCSNDEYVKNDLCSGIFESEYASLKYGRKSCRCSNTFLWSSAQREYQIKKTFQSRSTKLVTYIFLGWKTEYKTSTDIFLYNCSQHGIKEMSVTNLLSNNIGCSECSGNNQMYSYIHLVSDKSTPYCLKYGIETILGNRVIQQNSRSKLEITSLCSFKFNSVNDCRNAENECKKIFQKENNNKLHRIGFCTKNEMKDGYSETTSIDNMDKIIAIYEKWGGVKQ